MLMLKTQKKTSAMSRGNDLSRENLRALGDVFHKYPDVQAVYVFGSTGSGKTHQGSDLDLAIIPRTSALKKKKIVLLTDLARLGFCKVDLVFLDTDDIVLKYEAVRQNKLVYAAHDFDRGSTYSRVVRQYLDFAPYLKTQREAYKRRIKSGTAGSHPQTIE